MHRQYSLKCTITFKHFPIVGRWNLLSGKEKCITERMLINISTVLFKTYIQWIKDKRFSKAWADLRWQSKFKGFSRLYEPIMFYFLQGDNGNKEYTHKVKCSQFYWIQIIIFKFYSLECLITLFKRYKNSLAISYLWYVISYSSDCFSKFNRGPASVGQYSVHLS